MTGMDLNLLRAFMTIYETGSLTRAAATLSVTQPSVSYALGRLRKQLGDPLFIRSAEGMTPTRRATELFATIKPAIEVIDSTVETGRTFEPASTRREFRLCLSDLGELTFLPRILRAFGSAAPNATLEIIPMQIDSVSDWLMRGEIDAAVASVPIEGAEHREILYEERYVCVLPQSYTGSSATLTLKEFAALPHIAIDRSSGHYQADRLLESMQIKRRVVLRLHHFSVLPQIVAGSDYAAIVPLRVAELFATQQPVTFRELPFQMPAFNVSLYWNGAPPVSPARAWFRETIAEALK
ncbi:LysR family transcriptional regulator [Paenarthrobacter nitroguajacolicus]|uniref:LysR family transcriptional regulator n=1 Tax=Paenarthrobacter nitroguajacolicus TaxID=211146 RepID=UPI001AE8D8F7|nr:LysR family transcriptional regulator [Paenarthrobacter nitroguajacolicus]MDR6639518.1 DNA-binding transcriptional LysR family regulator [Paenarthrobacter nitroguajacolicus]